MRLMMLIAADVARSDTGHNGRPCRTDEPFKIVVWDVDVARIEGTAYRNGGCTLAPAA